MNERILVVDDEKAIADLVGIYLTKEGFDVQIAYSGAGAAKAILEQEFDLALLDVMLPDIDGFELLRTIRSSHTYPVIMLTARDAQQDKIEGLSLGADDYVVKPFSLAVLYAKALALLRRARGLNAGNTLTAGTLSLDPERGIVTANGRRIDLPPKEFALLRALMERKNRVLTRDELLNLAWGWDFDGTDRVIDGHIKKLRRALGPHADCIKTVVKRGYKLEVDGDENQT